MDIALDRPENRLMEIFIFLALMIAMMWFVTSRGKKQQAQQRQRLEEQLVPGTWVMTIGGFFGRVIEIDGDVVTLESPSGVETIWVKSAIREAKEPPYAPVDEDETEGSVVVPDDAASLTETGPVVGGATSVEPSGPVVDDVRPLDGEAPKRPWAAGEPQDGEDRGPGAAPRA
ncbi:preprotein translocase subunit YajC [Georgenia sp. AZ-5]|uniref:preprotein translocase subunit YajC n=1 Tax=Georgenia sp. AZ-5 TaxID=3367526 RepID=UPI003753F058